MPDLTITKNKTTIFPTSYRTRTGRVINTNATESISISKNDIIERAIRVFAMLNILQIEIDELAEHKTFFRQAVKYKGKAFAEELEKQIKDFYDAMSEEANLYYNKEILEFEKVITNYIHQKEEAIN